MKVFLDDECLLHHPPHEILSGELQVYYETPQRLLRIRKAVEGNAAFQIESADSLIDVREFALRVHSEDYIEYLESAFRLWVEEGGDPQVQPYLAIAPMAIQSHQPKNPLFPETFPHPKFAPHFTATRLPKSLIGKAGEFISPTKTWRHRSWVSNRLLLL